ncbi:hypothetical protein AB0M75_06590 [Streptomyces anulatus]|uniref:hypothetical protein n=1 Tax=Streptomyces anulatus TaxID=1892 RepID=UPI0034320BD3
MSAPNRPVCTQEAARAAGLDVAPSPEELRVMSESVVSLWGDRWAEPDDQVASIADAGAQLARAMPLVLAEVDRLRAGGADLEGKDTREGASTPTISARAARTAVLVAIARTLREQPTGARLLDGLDELGEAVVCEDLGEIAAWADALASLAHIDDDLGAAEAQPAAAHTDYRAEHESIHVGHYTTEAAARRHCEALVSDEHPADRALVFDWIGDEDDPEEPSELTVQVDGGDETPTGYVVVPLTVAAEHDPDAE